MNNISFIDTHIHLFPEKLFNAIWKWFDNFGWNIKFKWKLPQLINYLEKINVKNAFLLNYAHKKNLASVLNKWNYELSKKYPLLIPFGCFYQDDDLIVLKTAFEKYKLKGIKIHCNVQKIRCNDEKLFPLYEKLIEYNKLLVIHCGTSPINDEYVGVKYFKKTMKKFPQLKVQVAHLGGAEFKEFFELALEYKNIYLDSTIIFGDKINGLPEKYFFYLEQLQPKIMFGSDFPNIWFKPEDGIKTFLSLKFTKDFYANIFYKNAEYLINSLT